jgi:LAS superfamily LD-carboxypeptidase LdcB
MMVQAWYNGAPASIHVVEICNTRNGATMYLEPAAAASWAAMCGAAAKNGVALMANSAWRSYDHQARIFARWEEQIDEWTRKPEDKRGKRPPRPAAPGKSRHHNGIAVDIQRSHGDKDEQGRSAVDRWLDQNAPKYGFAARVSGEPWHWEYVGAPLRA